MTAWAIDPGVDSFLFWPADTATDQIERFASEGVPTVREAVATRSR